MADNQCQSYKAKHVSLARDPFEMRHGWSEHRWSVQWLYAGVNDSEDWLWSLRSSLLAQWSGLLLRYILMPPGWWEVLMIMALTLVKSKHNLVNSVSWWPLETCVSTDLLWLHHQRRILKNKCKQALSELNLAARTLWNYPASVFERWTRAYSCESHQGAGNLFWDF